MINLCWNQWWPGSTMMSVGCIELMAPMGRIQLYYNMLDREMAYCMNICLMSYTIWKHHNVMPTWWLTPNGSAGFFLWAHIFFSKVTLSIHWWPILLMHIWAFKLYNFVMCYKAFRKDSTMLPLHLYVSSYILPFIWLIPLHHFL